MLDRIVCAEAVAAAACRRSPGFSGAVLRSFLRLLPMPLFAALALTSCSSPSPPLKLGISPWPPYEFLHLAREKGFFAQEGVEVKIVEFTSMDDAGRSFDHGQIDGGMFSLFEMLRIRDQSKRNLQVTLAIDFSDGADAVLARPGIDIVAELRGRRIGMDLGPLSFYLLDRALATAGLTLDDVELKHMVDPAQVDNLRQGIVDAVVSYPPARTTIELAGLARPIFTSSQIPREIVDVMALDETVVRERKEDCAALIRAFYRAVEFARTHPDEAMAIMAAREQISPAAFREALHAGIALVPLEQQSAFLGSESPLPGAAERAARLLFERKQILSSRPKPNLLAPGPAADALR